MFSYLLAESERIASLEPEPLATLRCSVVEQAEWLFDDENYKFRHNHGLFQDAGLYVAARNAGGHERSTAWIDKAESRFIENLTGTVDVASGIHLEHSPAYHAWITNIASGLSDNVGLAQDELVPLLARMQEAGGWLVQPDGNYPQFGDTDRRGAPGWMQESAGTAEGLGWLDTAGVGVVREDGSYLAFASWYHSSVHKHSDELSFVWFDAGNRIIVDSGRYGYYYDEPGRIYAESNPAHNTVHFGDPFRSRDVDPYGSGMIDATQTDGWYAMLGENRAITTDDFRHRRTLVFKPGSFVATIDYGLGVTTGDVVPLVP